MPMADYVAWAKRETAKLCASPDATVQAWRAKWVDDLKPLVGKNAIFELTALVVARWEFLGCLYAGHAHKLSNQDQAAAYASGILVKVNSAYGSTHPSILSKLPVARLLIEMLRNKSLHGFTPAAVFDLPASDCIVWSCQSTGSSKQHLTFIKPSAWTATNALHVDGETFLREFDESMDRFADHLAANAAMAGGQLPRDLFRQGFWWKLHPKDYPSGPYTTWSTDGP